MAANEVDQSLAEFEREKWRDEVRLRREEYELKVRDQINKDAELALRKEEQKQSRWSSPLTVAILAASVAGMGNAIVAAVSGVEQRDIERVRADSSQRLAETQAESGRILEVIKTGDPDKSAANLQCLL